MLSLALVGRPNVGKSTLFNRMVGKKRAIVHDSPGVTRDWQVVECTFHGQTLQLYDTAGLSDSLEALHALPNPLLVWVLDGCEGVTPHDRQLGKLFHKQGLPVLLVANKCEKETRMESLWEASQLGFGEPLPISAKHGLGLLDLARALTPFNINPSSLTPKETSIPTVVILGRPNGGKSSLMNRCLGYPRMITSPESGTTRDSIQCQAQWRGRKFNLVDTAGLRRISRIHSSLETLACKETYHALVFAHVAVLVIDAEALDPRVGFEKQDLILMEKIRQEGRALVIALNKWDTLKDPQFFLKTLNVPTMISKGEIPMIPLSCLTGQGFSSLWKQVLTSYDQWEHRLPTAQLNRWLRKKLDAHPMPLIKGLRVQVAYMTQAKTRPPTFVVFGHRVRQMPLSYQRYLITGLTQTFSLPSVRLVLREGDSPRPNANPHPSNMTK